MAQRHGCHKLQVLKTKTVEVMVLSTQTLQDFHLLNCLDDVTLACLQKTLIDLQVPAGGTLFGAEDAEADIYFLVSGRLLAVHYTADGREIVFAAIPEGGYMGELSALGDSGRSLSVYATEESQLMVMPKDIFLDLIDTQKKFRDILIQDLAQKIQFLTSHVRDLTTYSVKNRLAVFILRLAAEQNCLKNGGALTKFPTHAEIANHIGANREAVSRAISALSRKGVILTSRQSLEIVDIDALIPDED